MFRYSLLTKLKQNKYLVALIAIVIVLILVNIDPGTYLLGWDSIQTDLAPLLGIKRALWAVWYEYHGLGVVGGNAYAADLMRAISIWIMGLLFPAHLLRYLFHGLMIGVGAIGMYTLLNQTISDTNKKSLAFLGSLFYILNLYTIQIVSLSFEPFVVLLGFLPWEIWIFLKLMKSEKHEGKSLLIWFFLINILATPQAQIPQNFFVYLLALAGLTVGQLLSHASFTALKKSLLLFSIIILINSFWIFPQLYFLKSAGWWVREAKINQLSTQETILQNKDNGSIGDLAIMKNFYYDLQSKHGNDIFVMWKDHFGNTVVSLLPWLLFLAIGAGILKGKNPYKIRFLCVLVPCIIPLLSNTPLFSQFNDVVRSNWLFNQIFRSPFTKFVVLYAVLTSFFFTIGIQSIFGLIQKLVPRFTKYSIVVCLIAGLIIIYSVPAFSGNYFSKEIKVALPDDYQAVFSFFNQVDKSKRIALLPEYTVWGWFFTSWNYDGSGFLWYGIEQPIMSRTFDVWNPASESYYWELKTAMEAENADKFLFVLKKYNIYYLLVDNTLQPVDSNIKAIGYDNLKQLINNNPNYSLVFANKSISVYELSYINDHSKGMITISNEAPSAGPHIAVTNDDTAYNELGMYTVDEKNPDYYYPFLDAMTQTGVGKKNWSITEDSNYFYFDSVYSLNTNGYFLSTPIKDYSIANNHITIKVAKEQVKAINRNNIQLADCGKPVGSKMLKNIPDGIQIESQGGAIACISIDFADLDQNFGYLTELSTENVSGSPLFFYILDDTKKQIYTEDRLVNDTNYFLIFPRYKYGLGYSFNFQNTSLNTIDSINQLKSLRIYKVPLTDLKNTKFVKLRNKPISQPIVRDTRYQKSTYFTYKVKSLPPGGIVTLNQAFDEGWNAYSVPNEGQSDIRQTLIQYFPFLFGQRLDHFVVNNWANGWTLGPSTHLEIRAFEENNKTVIIIFWPQYLEFFGFFLVIATGACLFIATRRKRHIL